MKGGNQSPVPKISSLVDVCDGGGNHCCPIWHVERRNRPIAKRPIMSFTPNCLFLSRHSAIYLL